MSNKYITCNEQNFFEINNSQITHLIFSRNFNKMLKKNQLSESITHLIFNDDYNQYIDVDVLPKKLTHLWFGEYFNREINTNVLPKTLKLLKFGTHYNKQIKKHVLPYGLTELYLYGFIHNIDDGVLPDSLTHLYIVSTYNFETFYGRKKYLGHQKYLGHPLFRESYIHDNIKKCLKSTEIKKADITLNELKFFPKNLEYLQFQTDNYLPLNSDNLPDTLKTLITNDRCIILNKIPLSLELLDINYRHDINFPNYDNPPITKNKLILYNTNIIKLRITSYDKIIEKDTFPKKLKELYMNDCVFHFNDETKPENLEIFVFGDFVNLTHDFIIPDTVKNLIMPCSVKYNFIYDNLPFELVKLKLTGNDTNICIDNLPIMLKNIYVSDERIKNIIKKIPFGCNVEICL